MTTFDDAVSFLGKAGRNRTRITLQFFDELTIDPNFSDLDIRIAWRLLRYLNGVEAISWPSIKRLAQEACCNPRSVRRAVRRLTKQTADGRPPAFFIDLGGGWKRLRVGRSNQYVPNPWRYEARGTETSPKGNKTGLSPPAKVQKALTESDNLRPARGTQTTSYGDSNDKTNRTRESPYPLESKTKKKPEKDNTRFASPSEGGETSVGLLDNEISSTPAADETSHCSARGDAEIGSSSIPRQRSLMPARMVLNGGRAKAAIGLEQDIDHAEQEGIELIELQKRDTLYGKVTADLPSHVSVRVDKRCRDVSADFDGRARHDAIMAALEALKAIREKDGAEGLRAVLER